MRAGDLLSSSLLITGANGFVGTQIARRAVEQGHHVIALVRAKDDHWASIRLGRAWHDWPELEGQIGQAVEVVAGDVSKEGLGIDGGRLDGLVTSIDHIVHTAASVRFDIPPDAHMETNLRGSANILELASRVERERGLTRLTHLSTAYVAGLSRGRIAEDNISDSHGFATPYERSKFEAERLMHGARDELPITILRPSMIVGDSRTGEIRSFNTLYFPLRMYLTGRLRLLPIQGGSRLDMVPVDYVADSALRLAFDSRAEGLNFHITCPRERRPTVRELLEAVREWATDNLGIRLPRGICFPVPRNLLRAYFRGLEGSPDGTSLSNLEALGLYFEERHDFLRGNTDRLLGKFPHDWREYLPRLLRYATYMGFMHRSDRTVHEQILFRSVSRRRQARLFDVIDGKMIDVDGKEFRERVARIVAALGSMNVAKGSRVGIVGNNSSRYLAIDVAVGLIGAVSVPMYFTSPPGDIGEIMDRSGASLLMVGCRDLLDRIEEIGTEVPIVSFCDDSPPDGVIGWQEFIGGGADTLPEIGPVDFNDVATIRYTSSTTGSSKGVMFTHGQLRWMAECVASLPSWRARNSEISYLSFLPMSHVVEGILGAYSPYMAPAPVRIHFLADLKKLAHSLPLTRPTVFFSVPRFYENLWKKFEGSDWGRKYLRAGRSWRWLLRRMVRRGLLTRSGLDRCSQLIVGSAPISDELLLRFRELGIEVHNAYGLTEAPLLTINRLGENGIGTVGRPLPETSIDISDKGEILAKGPQVMWGYCHDAPLGDGWLHTGDLGRVDDDGYPTILGREKELIITSYGKNILPMRIEQILRDIPGVMEAMVVGDSRPYLTALIWVSVEGIEPGRLDDEVVRVNHRLSNPEKLKRWAVLPMGLSIEGGQQTANMKLRRQRVEEEFREVIESLYRETSPETDIHIGRMER